MIGNAGKKIQTMVELAEELYERVNELRDKLQSTSETVDDVRDRTERIEAELVAQRAVLAAIAEKDGIDVDEITAVASGEAGEADEPLSDEERAEADSDEAASAADGSGEWEGGETGGGEGERSETGN